MSHAATNWAIQQRGLKPATKIVLWHLCDRHNPDFGCFPTQARLAEDAEMSISSLNDHLKKLEELGLIRRIQCQDHRTKRHQATRYILGFEIINPQEPCPEFGDGADSEFGAVPSPENHQSHLRNSETNPVREPLSKPVKEEEDAQVREIIDEEFFGSLLAALGLKPDGPLPGWWQGWSPREHARRWQTDLRLTVAEILEVPEASRQEHPEPPDGPKGLDRIMQRAAQRKADEKSRRRRKAHKQAKPESQPITDLPAFYADWVQSEKYLPPSAISNGMRDQMLARGLVTPEQLRVRGIQ